MSTQPTILVKKSDGTSVRMTMEEFGAFKNKTQNTNNITQTNTKTEIETKTENLPMKEPVRPVPATSAPVKKIFEDMSQKSQPPRLAGIKSDKPKEADSRQWTADDNTPLLKEDVVGARKPEVIRTTLPDNRGDAFDEVIRNLKFPVRDELRPRLKSLIVSRVKDIRTDEQVGEYAMRAVASGGLGWSEAQVGELLQMIKQTNRTQNTPARNASPASNASHSDAGWQSDAGGNNKTSRREVRDPDFTSGQIPNKYPISNIQYSGEKPVLHDVVAPVAQQPVEQKVGMGPMEEFATFQMIDFRRLGGAAQAGEVMRKKFETMRSESLILYLRAIKAWRESPLYRQYQKVLTEAINQSRAIQESVAAIGWKWEEFSAINKLCSNL